MGGPRYHKPFVAITWHKVEGNSLPLSHVIDSIIDRNCRKALIIQMSQTQGRSEVEHGRRQQAMWDSSEEVMGVRLLYNLVVSHL